MKLQKIAIFAIINFLVSASSAQLFKHDELLGRVTDNEISVQFEITDTIQARVSYGTAYNNLNSTTSWTTIFPGQPEILVVSNLAPNTQYFYRLEYQQSAGNIQNRSTHTFHTQRPPGSSFVFTIQADPHLDEQSDTAVYNRCLKNQLEDNPDFMIDLGDFLMSDKLRLSNKTIPRDTVTYRSHLLRRYYESIGHSVPIYIAIGNHEGESGWNLNGKANNVAVWGTVDRKKYFMNPNSNQFYSGDTSHYPFVGTREAYFSWTWGDALFVVLDPYWNTKVKPDSLNGWRWTLGAAQYNWLKQTLESSDAKFKFVFCHHLIGGDKDGRGGVEFADKYEWGGDNLDGSYGFNTNRPGWYKPIKELLKEHQVSIFFHGHDHFFGKQEKECLVYQEVPQPSHPNFSTVTYAEGYGYHEGVILPNSGHLRVTVTPTETKVEYVRVYLPKNETPNRKNKDISAFYFVKNGGCYDTLSASTPILWNETEAENLVYPNPAKTFVDFKLQINQPALYNIDIINMNGEIVKQLFHNQSLNPGDFIVHWDRKNDQQQLCNQGTYTYRVSSNKGYIQSGILILTPNNE